MQHGSCDARQVRRQRLLARRRARQLDEGQIGQQVDRRHLRPAARHAARTPQQLVEPSFTMAFCERKGLEKFMWHGTASPMAHEVQERWQLEHSQGRKQRACSFPRVADFRCRRTSTADCVVSVGLAYSMAREEYVITRWPLRCHREAATRSYSCRPPLCAWLAAYVHIASCETQVSNRTCGDWLLSCTCAGWLSAAWHLLHALGRSHGANPKPRTQRKDPATQCGC